MHGLQTGFLFSVLHGFMFQRILNVKGSGNLGLRNKKNILQELSFYVDALHFAMVRIHVRELK